MCDIHFSLQNRHAGDRLATALEKLGVSNAAVTISGRATRSEKTISEDMEPQCFAPRNLGDFRRTALRTR
jgi:hypothetical protein